MASVLGRWNLTRLSCRQLETTHAGKPVLERVPPVNGCPVRLLGTSHLRGERLRSQAIPLRPHKGAKAWDARPGGDAGRVSKPGLSQRPGGSFVDWRRVRCAGGNGGAGCISMLSEFRVEFAGPDGGDGGNGGHVLFRASRQVSSLEHVGGTEAAPAGGKGRNKKCHGKDADHRVVDVPLGTIFRNLVKHSLPPALPLF